MILPHINKSQALQKFSVTPQRKILVHGLPGMHLPPPVVFMPLCFSHRKWCCALRKKSLPKKSGTIAFQMPKRAKKANFGLFLILTIISSLIKLELLFSCKLLYLNIIKKRKIFSFDIFFSREKKWAKKVIFSHFYFFFQFELYII